MRYFSIINVIKNSINQQFIRCVSTEQSKSISSTLRYRIIKPEEFTNEFENFVLRRFFLEEPMTKHFKITKVDECITIFIRKILEKAKQDQVSLGYYDEQNKTNSKQQNLPVCFVINHIENVDDSPEKYDFSFDLSRALIENREKYQYIGDILEKITENFDIFKEYQARRIMQSFIAGIEPAYANQGLFTHLKIASIELAREKNCDLIYSKASSQFSTRANLKLGYHSARTIDYSTYVNSKGQHVFKDMSKIHQRCTLTVKDLRI